jgi:IS1 family transposase
MQTVCPFFRENAAYLLTIHDRSSTLVIMNNLTNSKRVAVLSALCEGNSIRSTVRMTGVAKNTIVKMLAQVGEWCAQFQHDAMRNLTCKNLQVDEIWSFVYSKAKNVPEEKQGEFGVGDVWTFTAIDADTKLMPCWLVSSRDACSATHFMKDLASRLANRVQLTTDGHRMYLVATEAAFGGDIDYSMLVKMYTKGGDAESKYSPGECCGAKKTSIVGNPDKELVSTSYVERANLTMRMRMRRFTRLTNAFSKKLENHEHALALYFFHYNFIRSHQTLRMPPALKAKVSDHVWSLEELVEKIYNSN